MSEHGIHGYFGDDSGYKTALRSWMSKKHNWEIERQKRLDEEQKIREAARKLKYEEEKLRETENRLRQLEIDRQQDIERQLLKEHGLIQVYGDPEKLKAEELGMI